MIAVRTYEGDRLVFLKATYAVDESGHLHVSENGKTVGTFAPRSWSFVVDEDRKGRGDGEADPA